MLEVFDFLKDNNLLTPGMLAVALAGVAYQLNKSIVQLQTELKAMSSKLVETSANLALTAAILERIDEYGTKAEMQHRENCQGRWEARGGKSL